MSTVATLVDAVRQIRRQGNLRDAIQLLDGASPGIAGDPRVLFERALVLRRLGDGQGAIALWRTLSAADGPLRAGALTFLGREMQLRGDHAEAIAAFAAARHSGQGFEPWVYLSHAEALQHLDRYGTALEILLEGLALHRDNARLAGAFVASLQKAPRLDAEAAASLGRRLAAQEPVLRCADVLLALERLGPPAWQPMRTLLLAAADGGLHKSEFVALATLSEEVDDPALLVHAVRACRQHGVPLEPWYAVRMARALAATEASPADLDEAYGCAIRENPQRRDVVLAWGESTLAARGDAAALEALVALQRSTPAPLPALLCQVAQQAGTGQLHALLPGHVAAFLDEPSCRDARESMAGIWSLRTPTPAQREALVRLPAASLELLLLLDGNDRRGLALDRALADPLLLEMLPFLAQTAAALVPATGGGWADRIAASTHLSARARAHVIEKERFCGYQDAIAREGRLRIPDPFTGAPCEPVDSMLLFDRVVYSFAAVQGLWHVITGGPSGEVQWIWLPTAGVAVALRTLPAARVAVSFLATTQAALVRRFVAAEVDFPALPQRGQGGTRPALIGCVGGVENYAHQAWNALSGVQRLVEGGLHRAFAGFHFFGSEFFGPLADVFPELAPARIASSRSRQPSVTTAFDVRQLLVPVGGHVVTLALGQRLVGHARARAAMAPGLREAVRTLPTVVVGLRANDKAWVDQEGGIQRLIEALAQRRPDALFLLDAFAPPAGADHVSGKWHSTVQQLEAMARRIVRAVGGRAHVRVLEGLNLNDSIALLQDADVYLSPIGTLQHKYGWFTPARGVVYASESWTRMNPELLPGLAEAEVLQVPVFVFGRSGDGARRKSLQDARVHLENVQLDVDELIEAVAQQLDAALAAKASPRQSAGPVVGRRP